MFVMALSVAFTMSKSDVLLGNHKAACVNDLFVSHVAYATLPFVVLIVVFVMFIFILPCLVDIFILARFCMRHADSFIL